MLLRLKLEKKGQEKGGLQGSSEKDREQPMGRNGLGLYSSGKEGTKA